MEDLQQSIQRSEKKFNELVSAHSKNKISEKWTLFLVGSLGRVRILALSWGAVILATACLFSLFAGIFVWRYYQWEWVATKNLEMEIQQKELENLRKANERLMAKIATLEASYEAGVEKKPMAAVEKPAGETLVETEVLLFPSEPFAEEDAGQMPEQAVADAKVFIEKYSTSMRDGTYTIAFTVKNKDPGTPVAGYIVAVLVPKDLQNLFLTAPIVDVVNGVPVEPQKGQQFSIRNLKDIRLSIATVNTTRFQTCRLFVFNDDGSLMFVEDHKI